MTGFRNIYLVSLMTLTAGLSCSLLQAQDATDVLRYSFTNPTGTARSMGFGNALGSVGGDFGSLSVNPAGIGIYRRSEVMFTPSLKINNVNGSYLGQANSESNARFNFNNIGIVFTRTPRGKRYDNSAWKSVSFGFGINRTADFNRNYSYSGLNTETSYSLVFLNDAIRYPNDVNNNLGYATYLINEDNLGFYSLAYEATDQLRQKRHVEERGGMNEILFSFGGNYQEKLMLGGTISLPTLNYNKDSYFEEVDATNNPDNYFQAFRYSESLRTTGLGLALKLGAIYKPNDYFRMGVALHTPTWIALTDNYNQALTSNTETFKQELNPPPTDISPVTTAQSTANAFNYSIRTPWKAILSATAMLGTYGFITADYEYVDYQSARLGFTSDFSNEESLRNADIRRLYKSASNFRIGVEGRLQNVFLRGGFGYYGSPFKDATSAMNRMNVSVGIGYRTDRFFADLGVMHTRLDEYETPYLLPSAPFAPTARLENRLNNIGITVGFKM